MNAADSLHFVEQSAVSQSRPPQLGPVRPAATRDHIVNGGEGEALMVKVSVEHGCQLDFLRLLHLKL
ncbi:MAG: hypothetical protein P4L91_09920 [Burkholderiaceae bacterium]|nr:hypothetical protein [Burkholderiaceae bacterium]